ncbi:MAG: ester cyclase [Actinobacteria bacterium]|nr:ester cyclase [Actinomycetota bacterium]
MDDSGDEEIRQLTRCLYAALDRQDWATVEALVSSRMVAHVAGSPPMGVDEWRAGLEEFYRAFPDGRHVIEEVLVDGSHCVTRGRFVGTHRGPFHQNEPTGQEVSVAMIHIDRFQGDQLVEHRGQLDLHGLLMRLGAG